MPPTVILPPRFSGDTQRIWRAASDLGWPTHRAMSWQLPGELVGTPCVVYGEELFAQAVAQQVGFELADPPDDWLTRLPAALRGRQVSCMPLSQAQAIPRPAFIKPAGVKTFRAAVYGPDDALPTPQELELDPPVLVSEVVQWTSEFRCFCADGRVVAASVYLRDGELAQDEDGDWPASDAERRAASELALHALTVGQPLPPFVVIDVGTIKDAQTGRPRLAVIEANPAYASGLYGCNARTVLEHLTKTIVPRD